MANATEAVAAASRLHDWVNAADMIGCCRVVFRGVRDEVESGVRAMLRLEVEGKGVLDCILSDASISAISHIQRVCRSAKGA